MLNDTIHGLSDACALEEILHGNQLTEKALKKIINTCPDFLREYKPMLNNMLNGIRKSNLEKIEKGYEELNSKIAVYIEELPCLDLTDDKLEESARLAIKKLNELSELIQNSGCTKEVHSVGSLFGLSDDNGISFAKQIEECISQELVNMTQLKDLLRELVFSSKGWLVGREFEKQGVGFIKGIREQIEKLTEK